LNFFANLALLIVSPLGKVQTSLVLLSFLQQFGLRVNLCELQLKITNIN